MRKYVIAGVVVVVLTAVIVFGMTQRSECPTPETFVEKFNSFSVELLAKNPGFAEKEQRYYWQKHLEEMGCAESQDIIDNATYGGKTSDYE